jgi:thiol-disulfide isomerase/thioredoxin
MTATPSTMTPLETRAPSFKLRDAHGLIVSSDQFAHKPLLVIFMCNHCPYVRHVREGLLLVIKEYQKKGVAIVGINSNDAKAYPDDAPDKMLEDALKFGYSFPYLYDKTQEVAKAYHAACTPDFFLFDKDKKLFYRGQMDDSRPGNGVPVTGKDLRFALDALLAGQPLFSAQKPSLGCNIKWKPGNEPGYFSHHVT